jgi:hypothetical protein
MSADLKLNMEGKMISFGTTLNQAMKMLPLHNMRVDQKKYRRSILIN